MRAFCPKTYRKAIALDSPMLSTFDYSMIATHAGLIFGLWKLYRQNRRNHDANVKHISKNEYKAALVWRDFCERKGIDPEINGN